MSGRFADPYKRCNACGKWVTGWLDRTGPAIVTPCGHDQGYTDVCVSWSPVDGCACVANTHPLPLAEAPGFRLMRDGQMTRRR